MGRRPAMNEEPPWTSSARWLYDDGEQTQLVQFVPMLHVVRWVVLSSMRVVKE